MQTTVGRRNGSGKEGSEMKPKIAITAIVTGIILALAIGCVRKVTKDREWRNGQWVTKEAGK